MPSLTRDMFLLLEPFEKELKRLTTIQFDSYDPDFLINRIRERMLELGLERPADYLMRLQEFPEEASVFLRLTGINVSEFFRNPVLYDLLETKVFPEILWQKNKNGSKSMRVWSAGCACGEEPYSIAILLNNLLQKQLHDWQIDIFATDISPENLLMAKAGVYETDRMGEVKLRHLQRYFKPQGKKYTLKKSIRKMVNFSQEDLANPQRHSPAESIFGEFDLILCRNVMIYFNQKAKVTTFAKLSRALCRGGYLILGESEGLPPDEKRHFFELDKQNRIFVKN